MKGHFYFSGVEKHIQDFYSDYPVLRFGALSLKSER